MYEPMDRLSSEEQWALLLKSFAADDYAHFGWIISHRDSSIVRDLLNANNIKLELDLARTEVASRSFMNWNALRRGAAASKAPTRYYLSRSFQNFILDLLRKQSKYEKRHTSLTAFDASGEEQGQRDARHGRFGLRLRRIVIGQRRVAADMRARDPYHRRRARLALPWRR